MCAPISEYIFRVYCTGDSEHKELYLFKYNFVDSDDCFMQDGSGHILACTGLEHFSEMAKKRSCRFKKIEVCEEDEEQIISIYIGEALEHTIAEADDNEQLLYDMLCLIDDVFLDLGHDCRECHYDESEFVVVMRDVMRHVFDNNTISGFFGSADSKNEFVSELNANIRYIEANLLVVSGNRSK